MSRCEVCKGRVEKTCGYDDQPMLHFCVEHYAEHLEGAHPRNKAAQDEGLSIQMALDGPTRWCDFVETLTVRRF